MKGLNSMAIGAREPPPKKGGGQLSRDGSLGGQRDWAKRGPQMQPSPDFKERGLREGAKRAP